MQYWCVQVQRYSEGQLYNPHYDSTEAPASDGDGDGDEDDDGGGGGGGGGGGALQRTTTALMYLEVIDPGHSRGPEIDRCHSRHAAPVRGRSL